MIAGTLYINRKLFGFVGLLEPWDEIRPRFKWPADDARHALFSISKFEGMDDVARQKLNGRIKALGIKSWNNMWNNVIVVFKSSDGEEEFYLARNLNIRELTNGSLGLYFSY
jgi:hypothetical protein